MIEMIEALLKKSGWQTLELKPFILKQV
jgi:hypothetical protein